MQNAFKILYTAFFYFFLVILCHCQAGLNEPFQGTQVSDGDDSSIINWIDAEQVYSTTEPCEEEQYAVLELSDQTILVYFNLDVATSIELYQVNEPQTHVALLSSFETNNSEQILTISDLNGQTRYSIVSDSCYITVTTLDEESIFEYQTDILSVYENVFEEFDFLDSANALVTRSFSGEPYDSHYELIDYLLIENNGSKPLVSPFLVSDLFLNVSNLDIFKTQIEELTSDDALKAKLVWNHLYDHRSHYCAAGDYGYFARSALNILSSFGYGCCDNVSNALISLGGVVGLQGRQVAVDGNGGHSTAELYYNNAWHMFDVDFGQYYDDIHGVASMQTLVDTPDLVYRPGYNSLVRTTTSISPFFVTRELSLEENFVDPLSLPSANSFYQTFLAFEIYPNESLIYYARPQSQGYVTLKPYTDHGEPSGYSHGKKNLVYGFDGTDARVQVRENKLYIALFSAHPLLSGELSLILNSGTIESIVAIKDSEIKDRAEIEFTNSEAGQYAIDLAQIKTQFELKLLSDIHGLTYPYTKMPEYYLEIQLTDSVSLSDVSSLTGEIWFQISQNMLPRVDYLESYSYWDRNYGCDKSVLVDLGGLDEIEISGALDDSLPCL